MNVAMRLSVICCAALLCSGASKPGDAGVVKMQPVVVEAPHAEFILSSPIYDYRLLCLKSRDLIFYPESYGTFRVEGAKDGDRIVRIEGKALADMERGEWQKLLFRPGVKIELEVQSKDTKRTQQVVAVCRLAPKR